LTIRWAAPVPVARSGRASTGSRTNRSPHRYPRWRQPRSSLRWRPTRPRRPALESTDAHRSVLVEPLLRAIECGLENPSGASPEDATLFSYALYVLAKGREPRAYSYVVRWLSLPGEAPFEIAGDVVT
jgi:hypothetical protein